MAGIKERLPNGRIAATGLIPWEPSRWDDGAPDPDGYVRVYRPDHPSATPSGWVHRFHVVWWLQTGEVVKRPFLLHHKNEIKKDDAFDNLEKLTIGDHTRHHHSKPLIVCSCIICGQPFELPQWRINQGKGKYCSTECYHLAPQSEEEKERRVESRHQGAGWS